MKTKDIDIPLGDRMKMYEAEYETNIESGKHIICRIDGHHFSSFTRGFNKPFDSIISKAMELTAMDLLTEFNATTSYVQSDEITLVIPSYEDNTVDNRKSTKHKLHKLVRENWNHAYSGRVQKMASLIAGFTTMKFNKHLSDLVFEYPFQDRDYETGLSGEYERTLHTKLGNAWFDARIYGVESKEEAFNSFLWRSRDNTKNSKSNWSQHTLAMYYMKQSLE